jgi:hypothetical protein
LVWSEKHCRKRQTSELTEGRPVREINVNMAMKDKGEAAIDTSKKNDEIEARLDL